MVFALIFAGGQGTRMGKTTVPKQFLQVYSKPVIAHTIEKFQNCDTVDSIVIVCLNDYIPQMINISQKYHFDKVASVVPGGNAGQSSIYNGLIEINRLYNPVHSDIVLIHDGVRPLIDEKTILDNIEKAANVGACVTTSPATETILTFDENGTPNRTIKRDRCFFGRAPQTFHFGIIYDCHQKALKDGLPDFVDSASMVLYYKHPMVAVTGPVDNIKITTEKDYYLLRAMFEAQENEQFIE